MYFNFYMKYFLKSRDMLKESFKLYFYRLDFFYFGNLGNKYFLRKYLTNFTHTPTPIFTMKNSNSPVYLFLHVSIHRFTSIEIKCFILPAKNIPSDFFKCFLYGNILYKCKVLCL